MNPAEKKEFDEMWDKMADPSVIEHPDLFPPMKKRVQPVGGLKVMEIEKASDEKSPKGSDQDNKTKLSPINNNDNDQVTHAESDDGLLEEIDEVVNATERKSEVKRISDKYKKKPNKERVTVEQEETNQDIIPWRNFLSARPEWKYRELQSRNMHETVKSRQYHETEPGPPKDPRLNLYASKLRGDEPEEVDLVKINKYPERLSRFIQRSGDIRSISTSSTGRFSPTSSELMFNQENFTPNNPLYQVTGRPHNVPPFILVPTLPISRRLPPFLDRPRHQPRRSAPYCKPIAPAFDENGKPIKLSWDEAYEKRPKRVKKKKTVDSRGEGMMIKTFPHKKIIKPLPKQETKPGSS